MALSIDTRQLVPDARSFLSELSHNNSRDWFRANKGTYDALLKRPAEVLLSQIAQGLEQRHGQVRGKLFRPQRDVRFTEDKTPYHLHLHMLWSMPDGRCWFFGISLDYVTAGAGVMAFDPERLERFRAAVADDSGAELAAILDQGGWRCDPPELKRVPQPWPAEHPREGLLRRKGLVAWDDSIGKTAEEGDLRGALEASFERMDVLQCWLGDAIG